MAFFEPTPTVKIEDVYTLTGTNGVTYVVAEADERTLLLLKSRSTGEHHIEIVAPSYTNGHYADLQHGRYDLIFEYIFRGPFDEVGQFILAKLTAVQAWADELATALGRCATGNEDNVRYFFEEEASELGIDIDFDDYEACGLVSIEDEDDILEEAGAL